MLEELTNEESQLEGFLIEAKLGPLVPVLFTLYTGDMVKEYIHPSELHELPNHPMVGVLIYSARILWDGINARAWDMSL